LASKTRACKGILLLKSQDRVIATNSPGVGVLCSGKEGCSYAAKRRYKGLHCQQVMEAANPWIREDTTYPCTFTLGCSPCIPLLLEPVELTVTCTQHMLQVYHSSSTCAHVLFQGAHLGHKKQKQNDRQACGGTMSACPCLCFVVQVISKPTLGLYVGHCRERLTE